MALTKTKIAVIQGPIHSSWAKFVRVIKRQYPTVLVTLAPISNCTLVLPVELYNETSVIPTIRHVVVYVSSEYQLALCPIKLPENVEVTYVASTRNLSSLLNGRLDDPCVCASLSEHDPAWVYFFTNGKFAPCFHVTTTAQPSPATALSSDIVPRLFKQPTKPVREVIPAKLPTVISSHGPAIPANTVLTRPNGAADIAVAAPVIPWKRIVFLIQAHKDTVALQFLLSYLPSMGDHVVVHWDKKSGPIPDSLRKQNVHFVEKRVAVEWGKWSQVQACLNGIMYIDAKQIPCDWLFYLSGDDLPCKSISELHLDVSLQVADVCMEAFRIYEGSPVTQHARPHAVYKRYFVPGHPFTDELACYFGSQWWSARYTAIQKALASPLFQQLKEFYRSLTIPDESFFQTLFSNLNVFVLTNNRRHIVWKGDYHPEDISLEEYQRVVSAKQTWFTRKVTDRRVVEYAATWCGINEIEPRLSNFQPCLTTPILATMCPSLVRPKARVAVAVRLHVGAKNLHWLDEALFSLLRQTYQDFTVVLAIDGFVEDARKIAAVYNLPFVASNESPHVSHMARLFRRVVETTTSEFFKPLDYDDLLAPLYLETAVQEMDAKKLDHYSSDIYVIDGRSFVNKPAWFTQPDNLAFLADDSSKRNPISHPATLVRVSAAKAAGNYLYSCTRYGDDDFDLWHRMWERKAKFFKHIGQYLAYYRVHDVSCRTAPTWITNTVDYSSLYDKSAVVIFMRTDKQWPLVEKMIRSIPSDVHICVVHSKFSSDEVIHNTHLNVEIISYLDHAYRGKTYGLNVGVRHVLQTMPVEYVYVSMCDAPLRDRSFENMLDLLVPDETCGVVVPIFYTNGVRDVTAQWEGMGNDSIYYFEFIAFMARASLLKKVLPDDSSKTAFMNEFEFPMRVLDTGLAIRRCATAVAEHIGSSTAGVVPTSFKSRAEYSQHGPNEIRDLLRKHFGGSLRKLVQHMADRHRERQLSGKAFTSWLWWVQYQVATAHKLGPLEPPPADRPAMLLAAQSLASITVPPSAADRELLYVFWDHPITVPPEYVGLPVLHLPAWPAEKLEPLLSWIATACGPCEVKRCP